MKLIAYKITLAACTGMVVILLSPVLIFAKLADFVHAILRWKNERGL